MREGRKGESERGTGWDWTREMYVRRGDGMSSNEGGIVREGGRETWGKGGVTWRGGGRVKEWGRHEGGEEVRE